MPRVALDRYVTWASVSADNGLVLVTAVITIGTPADATDLDATRALFIEYGKSLDFSLAYQDFEAELASFPGKYAAPGGALLLARADGVAAGAVGLRQLDPATGPATGPVLCEMKRLYVRPAYRTLRTGEGSSIGRALAVAILAEARRLGYRRVRLDTVASTMGAAIRLYTSLGFTRIPAYYSSPIPDTVYMELAL